MIRYHRLRLCFAGLIAFATLFLLPGCGNSPYPTGDAAKATFYTVFADDPLTMDPSLAYDFNSEAIAALVYPSYYQYHWLKRNPLVLLPALGAEEAKVEQFPVTVLDEGQPVKRTGERWTFRINKRVRFQDDPCFAGGRGRDVVAADF